jgi:hypothetical protein
VRKLLASPQQYMSLVLGAGSVLCALGHYEYFAWTNPNGAVAKLNRNVPNENQKEVIGIICLLPKRIRP